MSVLAGQLALLPELELPVVQRRSSLAASFGGARATGDASRDEARTPPALFAAIHRELRLTLDVCASAAGRNACCQRAYCLDEGQNSLALPWPGRPWVQPPFSQAGDFADKARHEVQTRETDGAELVAWLSVFRPETQTWVRLLSPLAPKSSKTTTATQGTGRLGETKWRWYGWTSRGAWGDVALRILHPRVDYLQPDGSPFESGVGFGSALVVLTRKSRRSPARRK